MSAVFRNPPQEPFEVSTSWTLAEQIDDAGRWLAESENADLVRGAVLDIGFDCRLGNGIAVQGEALPWAFMRQLADYENTLWLSIYPPQNSI